MSRKAPQKLIKPSSIPLSGYIYQNLVGISVLCDWLDDPTLYRWVIFECDEDGQKIEGLDDVVAERQDGAILLMQVKFTVNAADDGNALDWAWLTARKPKGRSLVQKWADAYFWRSEQGTVDASLLTNRRPDRAFAECLSEDGETVDSRKVPPDTMLVLSEQLGEARVEPFLSTFKFRHSNQGYLALERSTLDRYVPQHTTSHGWLALRHEALNWALQTASPAPDGRITIGHLRTILDQKRPKPLDQDFHVPPGYKPPDQSFYESFVDAIHSAESGKRILWGSPGQGKSTFLSYVCNELDRRETPYIRHHYFLRFGDSDDRFSFASVANSLMTQIEWRHAEHIRGQAFGPEHIREWIASCAEGFHRWGWLWLYQMRGGDPEPLMAGATRTWAIDSLMTAYPIEQIETILEAAEQLAFSWNDFPKALKFRWLKTNVMNGPDFQIEDFRKVVRRAVELGSDDYVIKLMAAGHLRSDEYDLYLLGLFHLSSEQKEEAKLYQNRLRVLINDKINAGAYKGREIEQAVRRYLDLAARTGEYSPESIAKNICGFKSASRRLLASFTRCLAMEGDLSRLVELHTQKFRPSHKSDIELEIIRTAGRSGAAIHEWSAYSTFEHHPIVTCWSAIHKVSPPPLNFRPRSIKTDSFEYEEQLDRAQGHLHDVFFCTLACTLLGKPLLDLETLDDKQEWLQSARDKLVAASVLVAATLLRGEVVPFDRIFRLVEDVDAPKGAGAHSDYVGFRRSLLSISSDLFALTASSTGVEYVPDADWARAQGSRHFLVGHWLASVESALVPPLTPAAAEKLIEVQLADIGDNYSYFNERAERYLELCGFAVHIGLLTTAATLLRRSISCVIGYGWRKNSALNDTISAIAAVSSVDKQTARACIEKLSAIITHISDMTEDDSFRSFNASGLLIDLMPDVFPAFYEHWIQESEWYYAENIFSPLVSKIDLGSPIGQLVAGAIWDADGIDAVRHNKISNAAEITRQLTSISDRFGQPTGSHSDSSASRASGTLEEGPIDVSGYGAEDLKSMIENVGESRLALARQALDQWFDQNVAAGQGIKVLKALEPSISESNWLSPAVAIFDKAFELSLRLQGKKTAYKWLVAAQIARHGWDHYYGEETQIRFDHVAKHYRKDWQKFVHDTAKSPYRSSPGLVIPSKRLVELMLAVGEPQQAIALTLAMVDFVLEDFSDQPLRPPAWVAGGTAHA